MVGNCLSVSILSCTTTVATTSPTTTITTAFQTLVHNLTGADLEKYYKANPDVASSIPEIISIAEGEIRKHLKRKPTVYLQPYDESMLNIVFRVHRCCSYSRLLKVWDKVCEAAYSKAKEVAKKITIILTT
jgi:hypothetical protein